jgi:ABC-type nitrate/sulfonate/bicarbonate transport system substrate-binding protein
MATRFVLSVFVLFITVAFTGCSGQNTGKATVAGGAKQLVTIRVAGDGNTNGAVMIANEIGLFREEGIEIKYTGALKGGATELQTIAQGINDAFVGGHPPALAQAILAGVKVKAVAPGMVDNREFPHVRYLVKEDSPIQSLRDIVGKKVSISGTTSPCSDGYLKLWLKQNNLPVDIEWVQLRNPGQQEQAVKQGLVDMTTSHPPYAGIVLKQGGVRQIATSYDILKNPAAGLSIAGFSEKFIQEHPDIVRGFCRALAKGRLWINAHQKEAAEIVAKKNNLNPDEVSIFWYDEHAAIEPAYMELWFKIAEDLEMWKPGAIQPTDIYTNEFAPGK